MAHQFLAPEIIKRKRSGEELSAQEIQFMVQGFVDGSVPDYQMSALLMAIFFRGMTDQETWILTDTMMRSGRVLDFSPLGIAVDKHSTGGVGDKTSLILAPIAAAAGVPVPMIAGRGLGHTGGTIDKLEAIPGFSCDLQIATFENQVAKNGLALIGQTGDICPADKRIYALRDVTATVESLPLICASIMSKKMAEGIQALVLDVKWGSGAFMKTREQAEELAKRLCAIGQAGGKKVVALVTDMNQPLGRFIGNALEIEECLAILKREGLRGRALSDFADCENLSVELAGIMIWLGGKAATVEEGVTLARALLDSGAALGKFKELVSLQGGRLDELPKASAMRDVCAEKSGVVQSIQTEQVGYAALILGAGRAKSSDVIDPLAGIEVLVRLGDFVEKGAPLYRIYGGANGAKSTSSEKLEQATRRLLVATHIAESQPKNPPENRDKSLPSSDSNALIAMRLGFDGLDV
ncbi:MAG: thymidine phosphorylase [Bdellovibrionales bacterium]|jgi:pyrimidine-nucleoside phosphorylase|nr:thymidine phosphorylase [Bdellovibrionales bacterium]